MKRSGFTFIELVVVIGLLSLIAVLTMSTYQNVIKRARDVERKNDIRKIQVALEQYYAVHKTYQVAGAGYNRQGVGYAGFENGSTYRTAITRALQQEGYLKVPLLDDPIERPGYMIYLCDGGHVYSISATLEIPTQKETDFARTRTCNGSGGNGTVTRYGKNYAVTNRPL